jgi:hypothetical protein
MSKPGSRISERRRCGNAGDIGVRRDHSCGLQRARQAHRRAAQQWKSAHPAPAREIVGHFRPLPARDNLQGQPATRATGCVSRPFGIPAQFASPPEALAELDRRRKIARNPAALYVAAHGLQQTRDTTCSPSHAYVACTDILVCQPLRNGTQSSTRRGVDGSSSDRGTGARIS